MPNEELIRTVIKRIERDLEMWDQGTWGRLEADSPFWNINKASEMVKAPKEAEDEGMWGDQLSSVSPLTDIDLATYGPQLASCGTTFCFAGHTVLEAGDAMLVSTEDFQARLCRTQDGEVRHIYHRAKELLGLEEYEASELFSAGIEDIDDLKNAIHEVTGVTFE